MSSRNLPLIEKIKANAIEDECGCWIWQGATQANGKTPKMNHGGRVTSVRRLILQEQGVPMVKRLASTSCGNVSCVHPDHVQPVTRSQLQLRNVAATGYTSAVTRRQRLADKARLRSTTKLTMELADQIRAAEGSSRAVAKRFGVSQTTVLRILAGRVWQRYTSFWAGLL